MYDFFRFILVAISAFIGFYTGYNAMNSILNNKK